MHCGCRGLGAQPSSHPSSFTPSPFILRRPDPRHALAGHGQAACSRSMPRWRPIWLRSPTPARPSFRSATPAEQIGHPLDGMGVVVPAVERSPILACSFSSRKYPHRRRRERSCCGCSWAGPAGRNWPKWTTANCGRWSSASWPGCSRSAASLVIAASLIGRARCRSTTSATRSWSGGSRPAWRPCPNLQLAGNAYHGVGIPDCIHGGELAAQRVLTEKTRLGRGGQTLVQSSPRFFAGSGGTRDEACPTLRTPL